MKKFLKFICFTAVIALIISSLSFFMNTNSEKDGIHIRGFFKEPENSVDVLLIGASELYTGFNSPRAWSQFGFTSYAISFAGMQGSLYKPILKKALKSQSPKLVVFEVNGFLYGDGYYKSTKPAHAWFDSVGMDREGRAFIKENYPEKGLAEFYFPFIKYHSNWRRPVICLRNAMCRMYLAAEQMSYTKSFANSAFTREDGSIKKKKLVFGEKSKKYLEDLLALCREENLNVLFIRTPHCFENTNPQAEKEMENLLRKYGYPYVSFNNAYAETGIDTKNDFYNGEHLNIYGMEKFTDYFGRYIVENYDVKTEHPKEISEQWDRCAEVTEKVIEECKADENKNVYFELTAFETAKGRRHTPVSIIRHKK